MRRLGRGGMGRVYEVIDEDTGERCALKVSNPDLDEHGVRLCLHEAWLASRIDHPNVPKVHAYGRLGPHVWMAMELVEGKSLTQRCQDGDLDVQARLTVFRDLARIVHDLHELGVVHRDIKRDNVLVDDDGLVFLVDFGIAKLDGDVDPPDVFHGTPRCTPPERLLQEGDGAPGDLFQLGVLAFDLFARTSPWPPMADPVQTALAICTHPPAELAMVLSDSARSERDAMVELSSIVGRCLATDPRDRPASAAALALHLDRILCGPVLVEAPVWIDPVDLDPGAYSLAAACA
ncbi:MAG: serine/threonine-protein kinase [Deltaproteobacteria bacterium]